MASLEKLLEKYEDDKHINRRTWIQSNYNKFINKADTLSGLVNTNNTNLSNLAAINPELAADSITVGSRINTTQLLDAKNEGNLDKLIFNIVPELQGQIAVQKNIGDAFFNAADDTPEKEALNQLRESNLQLRNRLKQLKELSDGYNAAIQKDSAAIQEQIDSTKRAQAAIAASQAAGQATVHDAKLRELELAKKQISGDTSLTNLARPEVSSVFKEQCFILQNIYEIIDIKRKFFDELTRLPYEEGKTDGFNRPLNVEGQPFGFINRLTQQESTAQLFNMPPAVLSQLQPMIRLFKVDENNNQIPIEFPSKIEFGAGLKKNPTDITKYLKGNNRRGFGVGLKDFSFTFKGSDPFAVKKAIEARLTIYAASFEELLEERTIKIKVGKKKIPFKYTYADLALKTGTALMEQNVVSDKNSKAVIDNLDKLKFRLKAVVGYEVPKNLFIPAGFSRTQIINAINDSFTTLTLTPTIHEFKFRDGGEIEFTVNYLSYIEDFFDQSYFNIFSDVSVTKELFKSKMRIKFYESKCDKASLKIEQDREAKIFKKAQADSLRTLFETMVKKERILHFKVPYESLASLAADPFSTAFNVQNVGITQDLGNIDVTKDATESTKPASADSTPSAPEDIKLNSEIDTNSLEQVNYFYLNDLIEIIMENIENSLSDTGYIKQLENMVKDGEIDKKLHDDEKAKITRMRENYKNLRVVLGPLEIRNPRVPGEYKNVSLGDIPMSLTYFAEWMTTKVVSRDRLEYSLSTFVNDFIKTFVRNFLNSEECFSGKLKQRVIVYNSNVSSFSESDYDEISSMIFDNKQKAPAGSPESKLTRLVIPSDETGFLVTMGSRGLPNTNKSFLKQKNYMIYYAGRSQPQGLMTGDRGVDSSNGIFHYILGKNNGIVKNIKLTRTNVNGLRELRFEQEGFDGLQQLREVYDANIDTFLNSTAYPGTYIFINPRGFAPDTSDYSNKTSKFNKLELSKFGIGGYFMIIESSHTFAEGLAESKIKAKWVAGLESTATPAGKGSTKIGFAGPRKTKCSVKTPIPDVQVSIPGAESIPPDTVEKGPN